MNLTIRKRIILGFGGIGILLVGLGGFSLNRLSQVNQITTLVADHDFALLKLLNEIEQSQSQMLVDRRHALYYAVAKKAGYGSGDPASAMRDFKIDSDRTGQFIGKLQEVAKNNQGIFVSTERDVAWANLIEISKQADTIWRQINAAADSEFTALRVGNISKATALDASSLSDTFRATLQKGVAQAAIIVDSGQRVGNDIYHNAIISILIALGMGIALCFIAAIFIRRAIVRPLLQYAELAEQIAKGDLRAAPSTYGDDELGMLGRALATMVQNLRTIAAQTQAATENLNASAAELEASVQQQLAGTSEQSAAIQEITATMEEISQTGSQMSDRTNAVVKSAESVTAASRTGVEAAERTGHAIEAISEQTERVAENIVALTEKTQSVGEIITTVNEIAERSRLLAFNAAIQAAAAGEHGHTFSVVAEEIKHLADQAKEATVQVNTLLSEIQQGIGNAVMLTEEAVKRAVAGKNTNMQTRRTIDELVSSMEESVNTFQQIVAASSQQQIGIKQVVESVQNIRQASEQMTTGTRELGKSASGLVELGGQLRGSMEQYRL